MVCGWANQLLPGFGTKARHEVPELHQGPAWSVRKSCWATRGPRGVFRFRLVSQKNFSKLFVSPFDSVQTFPSRATRHSRFSICSFARCLSGLTWVQAWTWPLGQRLPVMGQVCPEKHHARWKKAPRPLSPPAPSIAVRTPQA